MLVFVKPKKDTVLLNLWHWELVKNKKGEIKKIWTQVNKDSFPFEEEDTQFQIACSRIYCSNGSILPFKASESPLKGNRPFYIPDKLLEAYKSAKDTPAIADSKPIDFSEFWKNYEVKKTQQEILTEQEAIKQQRKEFHRKVMKGDISEIVAMIKAKKGLL